MENEQLVREMERMRKEFEKTGEKLLFDWGQKIALMQISVKMLYAWKMQFSPSKMIEGLEELYEEFDDAIADVVKSNPTAGESLVQNRQLVQSGYEEIVGFYIDLYRLTESGEIKFPPAPLSRISFVLPPRE